jgi:hypothetical protein
MTDDFDDDDLDNEGGSQLVKDLRKQLKQAKKDRDDLAAIADQFKAEQRKTAVSDALKARGARPELAKFYTGEEASPEAVTAWLTENADLFGIPSETTPEDAQRQAAAERISNATATAPVQSLGTEQDLQYKLAHAKTREELNAVYAELENVRSKSF